MIERFSSRGRNVTLHYINVKIAWHIDYRAKTKGFAHVEICIDIPTDEFFHHRPLLHAENSRVTLKIWREVKSKLATAKAFLQLGSNKCLMKHWYERTVRDTRETRKAPRLSRNQMHNEARTDTERLWKTRRAPSETNSHDKAFCERGSLHKLHESSRINPLPLP